MITPIKSDIQKKIKRAQFIEFSAEAKIAAWMHYKDNPVDFIDDWMMTYDPRSKTKVMPFRLFERQKEYIRWLHAKYTGQIDGNVLKSRDQGVSWLNCAYAIYLWIFVANSTVTFISRTEDYVDKKGDMDSILEKCRFIVKHLPSVFLPASATILDKNHLHFMLLTNPKNGSVILGKTGDNAGRGGRSSIIFVDEAAFIAHDMKTEAAISQNSDCKIWVSTPNGPRGIFYAKVNGGIIETFHFKWFHDKRKTQEWYDFNKLKLDPVIFAQEIDGDFFASTDSICIPMKYIEAAVNAYKIEKLKLQKIGKIIGGLDVADEGGDKNVLVTRQGPIVDIVNAWAQGDTTQTARKSVNLAIASNVEIINYDNIGVGAGIKGEYNSLKKEGKLGVEVNGVNTGETPTRAMYEGTEKKNCDMFLNLKAELWWKMRRRFEKTYETINGTKIWPPSEMISIPDDRELITELVQPKYSFEDDGRIKIESKKDMLRRGIKSPNKADALMLAFSFAETRGIKVKAL